MSHESKLSDSNQLREKFIDLEENDVDVDLIEIFMREIKQLPEAAILTREEEIAFGKQKDSGQRAGKLLAEDPYLDDEEIAYYGQIIEEGKRAQERLVRGNIRLVVLIASKGEFRGIGLPFLDRVQAGVEGLIRAAGKYDWRKGKLSNYAAYYIKRFIIRGANNEGSTIRLSPPRWEILSARSKVIKLLEQELGREPTEEEVGRRMGIDEEGMKQIRHDVLTQDVVSLDEWMDLGGKFAVADFAHGYDGDEKELPLFFDGHELNILSILIGEKLTSRQQEILASRFGLGDEGSKTLQGVGSLFGITTRGGVLQRVLKSLDKLRASKDLELFLRAGLVPSTSDGNFVSVHDLGSERIALETIYKEELRISLMAAIETIPAKYRSAVGGVILFNQPYADIAKRLGRVEAEVVRDFFEARLWIWENLALDGHAEFLLTEVNLARYINHPLLNPRYIRELYSECSYGFGKETRAVFETFFGFISEEPVLSVEKVSEMLGLHPQIVKEKLWEALRIVEGNGGL